MAADQPAVVAYVLDSFPLIAYVTQESAWQRVGELLHASQAGQVSLAVSVVNLGEVQYRLERLRGREVARRTVRSIEALPIEIVDADWPLTGIAADLKATTPIAYADCFAAALAIQRDAVLVTGDPEFRLLEDRVRIEWLPMPE
jgi:predicted nucleic acid-binding protein